VFYLVLLIGICLMPFTLAQRTTRRPRANTITVTKLNDSGTGSLRQALADASDGDTIDFAVSGTISLTSGELLIDKSVDITGQPQTITVSRALGESDFRTFHVMPDHVVTIDGLFITGGSPTLGSYGGGVFNDHSTLTISNCHLTSNSSTYGGAISNIAGAGNAALAVLNSSISTNYAELAGEGIYNEADSGGTATVSLTNSTVSSNTAAYTDYGVSAAGDGGGLFNSGGTVTITDSVVSNNFAGVNDPYPAGTGGALLATGH
jgi:hypothetical protein